MRWCGIWILICVAVIATAAWTNSASATLLYDPVVTVVGDGTLVVSGTGYHTALRLYKHSIAGQLSPVSTVAYNDTASGTRLVNSASATSEASLTNNPALANAAAQGAPFSGTGFAYSAGYDAANFTASVNSSGTNANRSVGRTTVGVGSLSLPRVVKTQTQATAYNNNNVRGATGGDTDDDLTVALYSAGNGSTGTTAGWRYFNTNTQLLSGTITNVRTVELLGSNLFGSTGSGTPGIYLLDPAGVNPATAFITTGTGRSPYEFALFKDPANSNEINGFNLAYIADDSASFGGIQKWTYDGSTWTQAYVLRDTGMTYRGLAGQLDAATGQVTLFATTAEAANRLQQVTDTGANSTFTTLASLTSNDNLIFRGVALAPIPEPGSLALLVCALATAAGFYCRRWR